MLSKDFSEKGMVDQPTLEVGTCGKYCSPSSGEMLDVKVAYSRVASAEFVEECPEFSYLIVGHTYYGLECIDAEGKVGTGKEREVLFSKDKLASGYHLDEDGNIVFEHCSPDPR